MKRRGIVSSVLCAGAAGLAAAALCTWTGCDVEPTEQAKLTISPPTVRLKKNESQEFMASGGLLYNWSLEDTNRWALLSASTGEKITYRSLVSPSSGEVIRVLTCSSTLGWEQSNVTLSAEAYIFHVEGEVPLPPDEQ